MPLSMTPGSSIIASPELRCRHRLRRDLSSSALPILPQSVSRGARISGLPGSRICYGLSGCSPSCTDQTDCSASEGFYFQASNGSVSLPVAGYDYNSDWTPLLAGLSPAGMAASLAAPDPSVEKPHFAGGFSTYSLAEKSRGARWWRRERNWVRTFST